MQDNISPGNDWPTTPVRNLDMDTLRTLVAISQYETFSSAAERLHRTQSAITQQMQRLETQINLPLFEKIGRNKRLSLHGKRLVEYARHILAINDEALRDLSDQRMEGSLRLGSPHDIAETILTPVLKQITRYSPRIKLEIRVDRSPYLMEAMHNGELDLTISTRFDQQLHGVVLRTSPTAWIGASDYVHDPHSPIPLILADEPSIFRRLAITALEQHQARWQVNYIAPNLVGIKAAVRAGLGITARSVELLSPDLRVLGEKDGLPPLPSVSYFLWMRNDSINPLTRHVFNMLCTNMNLQPAGGEN
ncbi:LysR substrate-binding domain-containing protein [Paracandidimonas soli]|uniref:LysR substrate-binding domain-containing protein n=1 Tax=Paracandidimonas soli TaxID=1917182 RepID=UPI000A59A834